MGAARPARVLLAAATTLALGAGGAVGAVGSVGALAAAPASAAATAAPAAVPVVVIAGRGHGHGVGMAQDGALWLARSGRSAAQILQLFYPGTKTDKRTGTVRVPVASASSFTLRLPDGGAVEGKGLADGAELRVTVQAGALRAAWTGADLPPPRPTTTVPARRPAQKRRGTAQGEAALVLPGGRTVHISRISRIAVSGEAVEATTTTAVTGDGTTGTDGSTASTVPAGPAGSAGTARPDDPVTGLPLPTSTTADPAGSAAAAGGAGAGAPTSTTTALGAPSGSATANRSGTDAADGAGGPLDTTADTVPDETGGRGPRPRTVEGDTLRIRAADGGVVALGGHRYRGTVELRLQSGGIEAVNELDVEDYLRGMGEIRDNGWPAAALQAQAVAARTYALRTMASAGEVCPTQRCQVYLGQEAEYPDMDAAVRATAGQVLTYDGALAATFYSASGGGTIATPQEAFGASAPSIPYLVAGAYPTGDLRSWEVRVGLDQLARRLGYRGTARDVTVSQVGPSGRAMTVTVQGSSGPLAVPGPRFDASLGLLSTFFTLRLEQAATAPVDTLPPPPTTLATADPGTGAPDPADPADAPALGQQDLLAPPVPTAAAPDTLPAATTTTTATAADGADRTDGADGADGTGAPARPLAVAPRVGRAGVVAGSAGGHGRSSPPLLDLALGLAGGAAIAGVVAFVRRAGRGAPR